MNHTGALALISRAGVEALFVGPSPAAYVGRAVPTIAVECGSSILGLGGEYEATGFYRTRMCSGSMASGCASAGNNENPSDWSSMARR
jgi:hypothetical protein